MKHDGKYFAGFENPLTKKEAKEFRRRARLEERMAKAAWKIIQKI